MKSRRPVLSIAAIGIAFLLSACGERDIGLKLLRNAGSGPEEFGIVPNRPLEMPEDLFALPTPTPGAANRTDLTPISDAVAALGGDPARTQRQGSVPASDGAIVNYASRFGRDPDIRPQLAAEDLEFRQRKSRFTFKVVPEDEYNDAYRRFRINPYNELERFRRAGIQTPAAPPEQTN
ncbi:MAG: DUF3035 domain-containing protein [Pseudomonadota bacterium]